MPHKDLSEAEKKLFQILRDEAEYRFDMHNIPIKCDLKEDYGSYCLTITYEAENEPRQRTANFYASYVRGGMIACDMPLRPDAMIELANWYKRHG